MSTPSTPPGPPSKHHMAVMIWLAVFPTITLITAVGGPLMASWPLVLRTLVTVSLTVPTVVYLLLPQLQRVRRALLKR